MILPSASVDISKSPVKSSIKSLSVAVALISGAAIVGFVVIPFIDDKSLKVSSISLMQDVLSKANAENIPSASFFILWFILVGQQQ